jgi:tetratricopeptide (TPR) repeat protein
VYDSLRAAPPEPTMSVLDEIELRAQFEARRALGASALLAWACARLPRAPASHVRAGCVRAALLEALVVPELRAVEALAPLLREGPRASDVALWAACEASPHAGAAARIAEALVACEPSGNGLRRLAALHEREGRVEDALAGYRRAIASHEGVADLEGLLRASLELARLLALRGRGVEALALLPEVERLREILARRSWRLSPRDTLILARIELAASGRYQRAQALDRLVDLVASGGAPATAALRLLVRHVERTDVSLSAVERERIGSVLASAKLSGAPAELLSAIEQRVALAAAPTEARELALVRAASFESPWFLERARAVRDGGTAGPPPEAPERRIRWLSLFVIAELRARRVTAARAAMREIVASAPAPDALAWTMLARALPEVALRHEVISLASSWLGAPDAAAPAHGYLELAIRFEKSGLADLAGLALARAREAHEPEARALSIRHAIRRAWSLREGGEIHEAHRSLEAALRDARAGSGISSSRAP